MPCDLSPSSCPSAAQGNARCWPCPLLCSRYKYYIFLNSSIKGPFVPAYMPGTWQWTQAYTDGLRGDVKAVGSSLVCLPEVDAGVAGHRSWGEQQPQTGTYTLILI